VAPLFGDLGTEPPYVVFEVARLIGSCGDSAKVFGCKLIAGSARDAVCNTDQFNATLTLLHPSRDMFSSRQFESQHSPAESILDDLNDLKLKEYACEKQRETQAQEARANRLDPARKSHRWYCQRQTASRASCKVVSKFGILFGKPDGHDYWSWSRCKILNTIAGLKGRLVLAGGLCTAKKQSNLHLAHILRTVGSSIMARVTSSLLTPAHAEVPDFGFYEIMRNVIYSWASCAITKSWGCLSSRAGY
jgi:hypothetical protein